MSAVTETALTEVFSVLTLRIGTGEVMTSSGTLRVNSNATRKECYEYMREQAVKRNGPRWSESVVVFFSVELNKLSA